MLFGFYACVVLRTYIFIIKCAFVIFFFRILPENEFPTLELTHNWEQKDSYDKGNGWGHICIETPDVYKACDDLSSAGIKITRPPGPMKHGTRVIAFCEDPDGYKVELNEKIKTS